MLKYLSINLSTWAISKTLGWRNGHPQIWKGPIATTRLHKKDIWQTWGASPAGKNNELLDSRAEAALPFWSGGIFAARLWAIWGGATGRGALHISFSQRQHGQPACSPATSTQPLYSELSSSGVQTWMLWRLAAFRAPTGPNLCQKECQIECQSIFIYLSIYLSVRLFVCLSVCLYIWLASWLAG